MNLLRVCQWRGWELRNLRIKNIRLWMRQSCCSLGFLSQNSLWKYSTFHGYKGIYSRVREEYEKTFFCKTGCLGDSLAIGMSREITTKPDCHFLSYCAPTVVTLQLLACFTLVAFWRVASCESLARSSHENLSKCSHTWILHTFLHTTLTWFSPKYRVYNYWNTSKFGME